MNYPVYKITYDLENLAAKNDEAIVAQESPERAIALLKIRLARTYDLYPKNGKFNGTTPANLGFRLKIAEELKGMYSNGMRVITHSGLSYLKR